MQIAPKRKMPDGREVSPFWGVCHEPRQHSQEEESSSGRSQMEEEGCSGKAICIEGRNA